MSIQIVLSQFNREVKINSLVSVLLLTRYRRRKKNSLILKTKRLLHKAKLLFRYLYEPKYLPVSLISVNYVILVCSKIFISNS